MSISLKIVLDTRRMKQGNEKFPVKLRVSFNRKSKDFQTIYDLSIQEFDKLSASRINAYLQQARDVFKEIRRTAENYVKNVNSFSFIEFHKSYILNNKLFRQRKINSCQTVTGFNEFDFSGFEKKFPILNEDQSTPDLISTIYVSIVKNCFRKGVLVAHLIIKKVIDH